MNKILEIKELSAGYDNEIIIRDINLVVHNHDFIGIIGPNGGGKTTLLKVILGLIKPCKGNITFFNDKQVNPGNTIGYLPQINQIDTRFPIEVIDVVLSGLMSKEGICSRYSGKQKKHAEDLLDQLGIYSLRKRNI